MPAGHSAYARVESHSWSKLREFGGENHGYGITREYEELLSNGSRIPAIDLNVGDLVVVTLKITTTGGGRYVAINDPLPGVFESVNPEFTSAASDKAKAEAEDDAWYCDHRELRSDRSLFFTDNPPGKGSFKLSYLARVVAEGDVIVPSARIEGMYDPSRYGMSATQRVVTLPNPAKVAGN
jgi:alpha-2-macroglobulin